MMELFEYEFIRRAFLVGILLAILLPCIGIVIVLKRLSLVGDTLSHASLAGVTLGILLGVSPVVVSVVVCVLAGLGMELLRKNIKNFKENAMIIVMTFAIAISGIFASKIKNGVNFTNYLFGSIVAISDFDLFVTIALVITVFVIYILLYQDLFSIVLDEKNAKLNGVKVERINFIFTVVTAITIALASKIIGVLIVSSLLVVPILCAMQISKSYLTTLIYGIMFSASFTIVGLVTSYYLDLRPGGAISLIAVLTFIILLLKNKT